MKPFTERKNGRMSSRDRHILECTGQFMGESNPKRKGTLFLFDRRGSMMWLGYPRHFQTVVVESIRSSDHDEAIRNKRLFSDQCSSTSCT